ncbi:hypothetical protein B0H14DRAFT_3466794 [Mycena olivaceomarginata]|nr:hypothetical protein B0H14DRAFT_3466794 [Mycena olivaceomarginata]
MAPFVTANGNKCPMCGNQLGVKIAKGGEFPGSSFIRCTSPFHPLDIFFHRFDAPATLPAPPTPAISMRALPPPPSLVSFSTSATTSIAKKQCSAIPRCGSTRIDAACPRGMCRRHCNQAGPCPLQAHEKERIRRQQLASASHLPALPDSGSVTRLLGSNFTTSEEWMSTSLHPMQAFDRWQEREQDHGNAAAVIRRLDNLYGVKSPTPETETVREQFAREEREDTELELGIQLSLAHSQPTSQQAGPSRLCLPSSIQQADRLRSLSASPELPAALFPTLNDFPSLSPSLSPPQPFPTPVLGRAQAPNVAAKEAATPPVPRKRRPAASVQKSTAPLRITTQLNKDWMAAKGGPIPQAAATHTTFHTARTVSRRPLAEEPEGVPNVMLVEEMKDVDAHADIQEPRPLDWMRQYLLFGITIRIIDKMLWFLIPLLTVVFFELGIISWCAWMCEAMLLQPVLQGECRAPSLEVKVFHLGMLGITAHFLSSYYGSVTADNGANGIEVEMKSTEPMPIIVELISARPWAHAQITAMSNFVLSLLNDLSVPSPHCLGETAALFANMGYLCHESPGFYFFARRVRTDTDAS